MKTAEGKEKPWKEETPERAMKQKDCTKVQLYEAALNYIALLIVLAIK